MISPHRFLRFLSERLRTTRAFIFYGEKKSEARFLIVYDTLLVIRSFFGQIR